MNQKGFAPIAIILIIIGALALGGGTWYYKSQIAKIKSQTNFNNQTQNQQEQNQQTAATSDETKDWRTYRNEEYGVEMKYPKEWEISCVDGWNSEECKNSFEVLISGAIINNQSPQIYINIGNENKTPKELFLLRKKQFPFLEVFSEAEINTGGSLGYGGLVKLSRGGNQQIEKAVYLTKLNTYELYFAEAGNSDIKNLKWQSTFNQILSTFKFID